jgi:hypothetical protein
MSIVPRPSAANHRPTKPRRRTATAVLAGHFDLRPLRDVLTSLLNGVGPYKVVEKDEDPRRTLKRERKEERKRVRAGKARETSTTESGAMAVSANARRIEHHTAQQPSTSGTSSFWRARPAIHIATMHRSISVTPPPMPASPQHMHSSRASTPGPSSSSSTSRTSSKRPLTPDDDEELRSCHHLTITTPPKKPKKRVAVKKGWKGWVEGSPPPSEKLINLDAVPVFQERRTRSGRSFDAIGVGKDGWV